MIYLIKKGIDPNKSFKIMESVRKGKVAKGKEPKWEEYKEIMREHDVPEWYIGSCEKIKYMFPKAHAAAYVTNAFRIAWFKVHVPKAYYSAFFSIRAADNFDAASMVLGKEKVKNKMKEIDMKGNTATKKEQDMYAVLELVLEMYERGLKFLPIDLYKSHYKNFIVEDEGIRPPFSSIAGFGPIAAESLYKAAKEEEFMSIDEIRIRAKLGDSTIDLLREFGVLDGMQESNQISLFG